MGGSWVSMQQGRARVTLGDRHSWGGFEFDLEFFPCFLTSLRLLQLLILESGWFWRKDMTTPFRRCFANCSRFVNYRFDGALTWRSMSLFRQILTFSREEQQLAKFGGLLPVSSCFLDRGSVCSMRVRVPHELRLLT